ncbi:UvrD-helicase domain-containing protein [Nocardia sp. NPDC057663]|uniref:UvrD-helicase domain-containing protein n=1 Tax=Nocardia sp. NPDC057663 TaxID=3346201 RepID=UPI00366BB629
MMAGIGRDRRRYWVEQQLAAVPFLGREQRTVLSVPLMEHGWHVLVAKPVRGRVGAFLVGRTGAFAVLFADEVPPEAVLKAVRRQAEEVFAGLESAGSAFVPHTVRVLVALPRAVPWADGRVTVVDATTVGSALAGDRALTATRARSVVDTVVRRASRYVLISTDDAPVPEQTVAEGLFTGDELRVNERERMLRRPFADWMTFLDPEQLALVHRNFNGPARLSGPAGTGKTVVALHRMARFAKREPGRILFTSFVRTLPAYHRSGFDRIAPEVGARAEFTGLHKWANQFLGERGIDVPLNAKGSRGAMNEVWAKSGALLADVRGTERRYWADEVSRVIKGRGIADLAEYQSIDRPGRNRVRLDGNRRAIVWNSIYLPYQNLLHDNQIWDFDDVIQRALDELVARPLADPYGVVVVDEVQDFTLTQLRLVHQIAGGRPNSQLLLVGDGQQQVYPGGWRLSDAAIPIVGRGAVLKVNYRNRAAIHAYAKDVDATDIVDDLDGGTGVSLRDSQAVLPDGTVETFTGVRFAVETELVRAVKAVNMTDVAVLVATRADVRNIKNRLERAGFSTCLLTSYDGTQHDAVKIGTVHRAKGLDFAAVFHIAERPQVPADGIERDHAELVARQTMVALTRARDYVWFGVVTG